MTDRLEPTKPSRPSLLKLIGWILGPGVLLAVLLTPEPQGLSRQGYVTAGVAALMAIWWITETIPIAVTALLPLLLFPLLGLGTIKEAATPYANKLVYLFLGGFVLALAMQRWGLHRRIAVNFISVFGTRPNFIIAGFLAAGALISMWVSNTATALMMLPIAKSVADLASVGNDKTQANFPAALMLAVAYGATTGGMATLIGTPPNALLAGHLSDTYGYEIGFGQWMMIGVPVMLVALPLVYIVLTKIAFRVSSNAIAGMSELLQKEKKNLGPMSFAEITVAVVFTATALCWVFRPLLEPIFTPTTLPGEPPAASYLNDTTIAIGGAVLLFLIPVNWRSGEFVMDWQSTREMPWGVLLLFGGGLSLAAMIQKHKLSDFIGQQFAVLEGAPMFVVMAIVCFGILMLTELTSNTATAATFLPIVGAVAIQMKASPLLLLVPTALAANCSYMMPVGTPPNAIVFGSQLVTLPQMARSGLLLNIILVPVVVIVVLLLGDFVFDLSEVLKPK